MPCDPGRSSTTGLAAAMGWPDDPERAHRVAGSLLRDGLAERDGAVWRLPT